MTVPVVVFAHRRPGHLRRVLEALLNCPESKVLPLYIFVDGARDAKEKGAVEEVRDVARTVRCCAELHLTFRDNNVGLLQSVTSGISSVLERHDRVIVLEDDTVPSPHFLRYALDALEIYEDDEDVAAVHGYVYPVAEELPETFFLRGADCWGWATWKRAWCAYDNDAGRLWRELCGRDLLSQFDLGAHAGFSTLLRRQASGHQDSWAIRWHASAFLRNMYTLYPGRSLITNIGLDGSGEHSFHARSFKVTTSVRPITLVRIPVQQSVAAEAQFAKFFHDQSHVSLARRLRISAQGRLLRLKTGSFLG